ncbi:MAG: hypothetical protein V1775_04750 [Bacteroidota bacterium]
MKISTVFLLIVLTILPGLSPAQEIHQKFAGIEAGMTFISGEMSDMDYIRGDIPYATGYYSPPYLKSMMYKGFAGIKSEFVSLNNKFGFSGGVRFSQINCSVGRNSYWGGSTDYFYLFYRQDGVNTEYLKVKELNQRSSYIGIPLEIRFFPYRARLFRMYFKLGAEFGFKLQTQTDVVFFNKEMDIYQEEAGAMIDQPESFSSSLYGAAGLRIGRESKPAISIEICLPSVFLTSKMSGLVNPVYGGGFQMNFQIPIKSTVK